MLVAPHQLPVAQRRHFDVEVNAVQKRPGQAPLVLADLLGVEPHTLRFGTAPRSRVAEPRMTWPAGVGSRERQTIDAYLQLSPKKRELVGELVKALSDNA